MIIHIFITWAMFIGLFPISYFWLKAAWEIFIKRDYSRVALKGGCSPIKPIKYAFFSGMTNLISGLVFAFVIMMIVVAGLEYGTWTAIVGVTFWMKLIADFAISRYAHMQWKR